VLYYKAHISKGGELPAELAGWRSTSFDYSLNEQVDGDTRVVAITEPFIFDKPSHGWIKLGQGWEVASKGQFNPISHLKVSSKWMGRVVEVDGVPWFLPVVIGKSKERLFKVFYGGKDFKPVLSDEQVEFLALANEIRDCHDSGMMPEASVQAFWAARLLTLTYCLSTTSISLLDILSEDLITEALSLAGGYHASID
jgi:hypothetical protein